MNSQVPSDFEEWLDLLDLAAIADPHDKMAECEYFLALASGEQDVQRFRWLISAFFGAAYSFFEISALSAFRAFTDPRTGDPIEDTNALKILRRYITISQDTKNPFYVKTGGNHHVTKQLYGLRKGNTHHFPLSMMATGPELPEAFHLGNIAGKGTPALAFCRTAMSLIRQVHQELHV